ncbi:MAG: sigma-70 family RNA polymerase sigma factor [Clostridia bacterium]|nr:sigma-70 family RNA polymerase sigma factor [Clostridia bacterium]
MNETASVAELVEKAKNGDEKAFEELYKNTVSSSYQTAVIILGNTQDAEDALQNAYAKAAAKLSELKETEKFRPWLKTIVENECKNYIKKERRINAPIVYFKNKVAESAEEWNKPVPQEIMEKEVLRDSVNAIVDKLSPQTRACIVLFHYEDKSLSEISEILGIPLGTVKSRLYNGRKQIEKEFTKLQKDDPTLYGIGAIPLVLSFIAFQAEKAVVPAALVQGGAVAAAGTSVAASTGAASASAAGAVTSSAGVAGGTASAAATTVAVKVAAVAVAGTVAVSGTVAVKNHYDAKTEAATSAAYTEYIREEPCTVAATEFILAVTEEATASETATSETELSVIVTTKLTLTETAAETERTSAAEKSTAIPSTERKATTTAAGTMQEETKEETTSAKATTQKATTTKRTLPTRKPATTTKPSTTQKAVTTAVQTTNPEKNYDISGGVITGYSGSETAVSIPASVNGKSVTAVGAGAFAGNSSLKSVTLPSSVTQIGQEAFAECTFLTSVSLPSSVELIGIGAFYGCSSLASVALPSGTKTIGDEAFAGCTSLKTVTVPSSVTSIGDDAFADCGSLTIRCEEGSAAHDYAIENSIDYTLM